MTVGTLFVITMYAVGCDVERGHATKAGTQPVVGFTVAADPSVLPLGSIIDIEGFGERMVHDVGGLVRGRHVDIFVSSCREARRWSRRERLVRIVHVPQERQRQVAPTVVHPSKEKR
jgi:3D (Asp-Asp-Asp) domain-containing protein